MEVSLCKNVRASQALCVKQQGGFGFSLKLNLNCKTIKQRHKTYEHFVESPEKLSLYLYDHYW